MIPFGALRRQGLPSRRRGPAACAAAAATVTAAALGLLVAAGCGAEAEAPAPHVLLISVDTLRRDALRAYAPAAQALPAFDALASASLRFDQAWSPAAWTLPAHASMLTGLYPHRHGAVHRRATLATGVATVAEALAARGYETAAYTDGGFLDHDYGLARGFERYDDHAADGAAPPAWLPRGGEPEPVRQRRPFVRAVAHLRNRQEGRPLFLFTHTYAVHDYFYANAQAGGAAQSEPAAGEEAAELEGGLDGEDGGDVAVSRLGPAAQANLRCLMGDRPCPPEEWRRLRGLYAGELRQLDRFLGDLLGTARERLADRPLWVILTSDHGEGLEPAAGTAHHGGQLHPDVLGVPLLVAGPGVETGSVATAVSLVDLGPTIAALGGGALDGGVDGRSLLPLLRPGLLAPLARRRFANRTLQAEDHYYWWAGGKRRTARDVPPRPFSVAVARDGWWLWRGMGREEVVSTGGGPTDAPEETLSALRRAAALLLRERTTSSAAPDIDHERERQLESLGYGGGA